MKGYFMGCRFYKFIIPALKDDFSKWSDEALGVYSPVLEKTIDEAYARENVIYSRAGALLSLNGIILALVCTYLANSNAIDEWIIRFLVFGIVMLVVSSVLLGYVLIPPDRTTISPYSPDRNYGAHKCDSRTLSRLIMVERTRVANRLNNVVKRSSYILGISILLCTLGMWGIGSSMIRNLVESGIKLFDIEASLMIAFSTLAFVILVVILGIDRIIEDKEKDCPHEEYMKGYEGSEQSAGDNTADYDAREQR